MKLELRYSADEVCLLHKRHSQILEVAQM